MNKFYSSAKAQFRTNLSYLTLLLLLSGVQTGFAQLVINEFSAANFSFVTDNYGEYEDWVEIYNNGSTTINLDGYHLSDKADNLTKWTFPPGLTLPAGLRMRIWCSKRDEMSPGAVHTNFKITQTRPSEGIYLSDPAGVLLDSNGINIPNQMNQSWGRITDGDPVWGVFPVPTPGFPNAGAKTGYSETTDMIPTAGYHTGPVAVTITHPDPTATIRYTTDGSEPNASSTAYTGPINLSSTTVLRARAYSSDPNILPGHVETNTYLVNVTHTVPIISIAGEQVDDLLNGNSWLHPLGSFEYFKPDGSRVADATGEFNKHGNDSWAYPQRGFDYITRDQLGNDWAVKYGIFDDTDRDRFQRLIVKAAANDNYPFENGAHIRDQFVHALAKDGNMHLDTRTYEPSVVYVNGIYWGVYDTREKVDDPDYTEYNYDQEELDLDYIKTWGATWEEYGSWADWYPLTTYMYTNDLSIPANYDYVYERYDVESLTDYVILNSWAVCKDWLNWNTAWWRGRNPDGTHKRWGYALWDEDATFGHYINYTGIPDITANADPCFPESLSGWSDPEGHAALLVELLDNPDFEAYYINRYADLNNTSFNCAYVIPFLDSLIDRIAPEMPMHVLRWGGSVTQWENNVQELRDFIEERCAVIDSGLVDCYGVDGPYELQFDVDPPMADNMIQINSITPGAYPFNATYFGGIPVSLTAMAGSGYIFDYWELINHTVSPSTIDEQVTLDLTTTDTIIAHFKLDALPVYSIVVEVDPPGSGNVTISGFTPATYPYTTGFTSGDNITLDANPEPGYVFDYWDLGYHLVNPDPTDPNVDFTVFVTDVVDAHFRDESALGLDDDLENAGVKLYPNLTSNTFYVDFNLAEPALIDMRLFSPTGEIVELTDVSGFMQAQGEHHIEVNMNELDVPAGVYVLYFESNGFQSQHKLIYMPDVH